jgi:hypothetical protein
MASANSEAEIKNLFRKCKVREEEWLSQRATVRTVARKWLFSEPKFRFGPKFTSPAGAAADDPLVWNSFYRGLVEQFKTADDPRCWYLLGEWLKSEGIRDPAVFFPDSVLKQIMQGMDISPGDVRNALLVNIWLPYTEPLLRKAKWLKPKQNRSAQLEGLGYDTKAVALVTSGRNWTSPIEFTAHWVAERSREFQPETLVNSYSRLYPKRHMSLVTKCAFCGEDVDGEFWVAEEAIPYCKDHHPDRLPESQPLAWADSQGRRYWRTGLEVQVTAPV